MSMTRPSTTGAAPPESGGIVCACAGSDLSTRSSAKTGCMARSIKSKYDVMVAIPAAHDCMRARTMPRKTILSTCLVVTLMLAGARIAHAQEVTVRVGSAPSIAAGALLIAVERGYFREVGIKVVIEPLDTAANAIALLAQHQYQIIAGR